MTTTQTELQAEFRQALAGPDVLTVLSNDLESLGLKIGDKFIIDPSSEYHNGDVVAAKVDGFNVIGKVQLHTTKQVKLLVPQYNEHQVSFRYTIAPIDAILGDVCPLASHY